jgi:hypothetical protein
MNTNLLRKILAAAVAAVLAWSAPTTMAQDSAAPTAVQPATVTAPIPQLAYGVLPILQLAQAKVSEDTIMAYIKNSGNSYGLNADQIIYLRQQGISDVVITTMLNQPRPAMAAASPATPAPQPSASAAYNGQVATATVAPAVTYVQGAPDSIYYSQPYYYDQPYYYPGYAWYPPVSFSFGWYGGWHGGGGYGGGWRGGGAHGGGYGGGGFHGGDGGGHGGGHR